MPMRSSFPRNRGLAVALWLVASPATAADWQREDGRETLRREFPVQSGQEVRLDLGWGELHVEPGDGDKVEVVVRAACHHRRRDCEDRIRDIDIEGDLRRDALALELTGLSKWHGNGVELDVTLRMPRGHALDVDMGAGEVHVEDLESDVHVDLGAGEIRVRMPEEAVRKVRLDAGVGDANLRLSHGRIESSRHHLVGGDVRWDEGRGRAAVDCHVGAGEVTLRLE